MGCRPARRKPTASILERGGLTLRLGGSPAEAPPHRELAAVQAPSSLRSSAVMSVRLLGGMLWVSKA